ncbi:SWI/SNF-related matrix-associated actin-dependent regulator of chromatin subfamily A-like protein 1 [Physella acuta]|uniref:SWI/SNF-related matrix-associated actin-dependent regulator of chromatin subfamily A-like protein 1 n=1 Tax=Physella acuta TaxID=109671 RepID=UPI0027DDDC87|nr:SWI/SNF-related matrix-associated actin-dependent regulator of chromatin subfamily A-like protein 1 [Physella acuta]XP_059152488.1 SWI/SNF-related matrix-associated actin-dependent regulator of chromatin subfamily A-like protein 1 [Physella acuta]XP_059152489.1 SWI/SNF-related matrix-associated actin-dependent regulator of chromatin subfamily A-like protein 1 [Physella acuta]
MSANGSQGLTLEQQKRIEENRQKALQKRAEKQSPVKNNPTSAFNKPTNAAASVDSLKARIETNREKAMEIRSAKVTTVSNDCLNISKSNFSQTSVMTNFSLKNVQPNNNDHEKVGFNQYAYKNFKGQQINNSLLNKLPQNGDSKNNNHKPQNTKGNSIMSKEKFFGLQQKLKGKCVLISKNMFCVDVGYSTPLIEYFKKMKTKSYDYASKLWSFKLEEYSEFMKGAANFQPDIEIEGLPRWILKTFGSPIEEEEIIPEADLSSVDGCLVQTLLPFQRHGINVAIHRNGKLLLADDMGLGKTLQAICIACYYRKEWPLLVVCPSSVRFDWAQQICKWLPSVAACDVNVIETTKMSATSGLVNIISYDLLSRKGSEIPVDFFKVIIMDESHFLKNAKTARTRAALPLLKSARRVLLLSGTPALSRPNELFCQITAICADLFKFHDFGLRYCNANQLPWGWDYTGSSNMQELQLLLEKKIMLRRQKKDVLSQLPAKTRQIFVLDHSLVKKNKDLNVASKLMHSKKLKGSDKQGALLQYFNETCKAKLNAVRQYLLDLVESDKKFLVFAHHKEMLDCIEDGIKSQSPDINYIRIDGRTSSELRHEFCKKFQTNDSYRVAILSITAANAGLNLCAASLVIFAELFWNPGILVQAEDRAHRIGQEDSVTIQYLLAKGTADDYIWPLVQTKLNVLSKAGLTKDNFSDADTTHVADKNQSSILDLFMSDFIDNSGLEKLQGDNSGVEKLEGDNTVIEKLQGSALTSESPKSKRARTVSPTKKSHSPIKFKRSAAGSQATTPTKRQASLAEFFPLTPPKKSLRLDEESVTPPGCTGRTNLHGAGTSDIITTHDPEGTGTDDLGTTAGTIDLSGAGTNEALLSQDEIAACQQFDWDDDF